MRHIKKISDIFKKNKDFNGYCLNFIRHNAPQEYNEDSNGFGSWCFQNMPDAYEFVKPIINKLKKENKNFKIFRTKHTKVGGGTDGIWLLFDNKDDIPDEFTKNPDKQKISIPEEIYNRIWKNTEISLFEFEDYFNSEKYKLYLFNRDINKYNL